MKKRSQTAGNRPKTRSKQTSQLSLDLFPVKVEKLRAYNDLTIHEKINYKANLCGFQTLPYRSGHNYFVMPIYPTRDKYDMIHQEYIRHNKLNAGGDVRIQRYRNSKTLFEGKII